MNLVNGFNSNEKILHHFDKLNYFFNGHKTLIVTELDLTNKCNNKCPACCGNNSGREELSAHQIDLIVDGLSKMDNKSVILSGGGEPLVSPYFEYAVIKLKKAGMKIGVNSNGLNLDNSKANIIAQNCDFFRISLDAATPELYLKTHGMGKSAFEQTLENIRLFVQIRNNLKSATSFGLGFLTSKETISEMEPFVSLAKDLGVDFAQFRPFIGDTLNVIDDVSEFQNKYNSENFKVTASFQKYHEMKNVKFREYNKCRGMFFSTVITADAKMFACIHFRQSDKHYLGTISEFQSIEDIFRSSRIRNVFESIDCSECPILCRNDAFNKTLDALSFDLTHLEFL